jgi:hypothetical protein
MERTFNSLLLGIGVDPAGVRLMRHVEKRAMQQCFDAAISRDERFSAYQESQDNTRAIDAMDVAKHVAGFVVDPGSGEVVFAGLWEVMGRSKAMPVNPFVPSPGDVMRGHDAVRFVTRRVEKMDEHVGKLVIDWGPAARTWVQRAERQDKRIITMQRRA